jgi:hypothetical protein
MGQEKFGGDFSACDEETPATTADGSDSSFFVIAV